ncbi:MAG: FAD-binding protein, partial [Desulfobulbia bacterium]
AQRLRGIIARKTILATGGCGNLFPVTSNSGLITGDGSAVSIRVGCRLRDMEFIQYTPTAFAAPRSIRGQTINGALLAIEGVHLLNCRNERFMEKYAPETKERSNRAVVSRSIFREVSSGRGTEAGGVYLDLTSVPFNKIDSLRPGFTNFCLENGLNPGIEYLQTAPSVHTCLGGVSVDKRLMAKKNLYIVGEAIGGTHGANRLSSNSLCEANVTGWFAAKSAVLSLTENNENNSALPFSEDDIRAQIRDSLMRNGNSATAKDTDPIRLADELRTIMGEAAGVERSRKGLIQGLDQLLELKKLHEHQKFFDTNNREAWLDLRNMIETSHIIILSALVREESRGAHARVDFPEQDNKNWLGSIHFSQTPVANENAPEYEWKFIPSKNSERPGQQTNTDK